ncbi:phosphate system positive regulatory protein pho81 [Yamadazyma tenuis]|uniref:SPX-domain-containing protein n=1 Tax=Candida tenuis (strain ATCC 10573 / BCRC 21748 / CBS 615 / JCM 9827 / NBRC 10315 / NRRL Y-1498 / VKM Y-70) TaxID=590646 RepID=G3BFW0_CANTC|nr:uncharacterized protein CANTEDRAFT_128317 [Yamadazyma tenuis ATCC 10573]EGV60743.1 hypothetical protein CANTEDRAFT_128317 [Yamadazyma tenuis ATCC 10573]WEJ93986.1 phosphate system positive regulatory protein pho81 [Yamadazyma tenuis]
MKFGKYLASRQLELPEYSGHFINYKVLKKLIKQLAIPSTGSTLDKPLSQAEIQNTLKENNASFFFKVERELEKVNSFYLEKQANLAVNLDLLLATKNELFLDVKTLMDENKNIDSDYLNSTFKNSITFLNLYQNFKKIHQDLLRLQQFILLNESGFSKVVKKWDKRSKSHTRELFISTAMNVQPVFHKDEINDLSDLVTSSLFDLESIIDGDLAPIRNFSSVKAPKYSFSNSASNNDLIKDIRNDTISSLLFPDGQVARASHLSIQNNEIDELYSSFVNIATIKVPDLQLLARLIDKVHNSSEASVGNDKSNEFNEAIKAKFSRVFLLAVTNLKISDSFLQSFLKSIHFNVSLSQINNNFNNNKNILHECCSIPTFSTQESNVIINNGVKVVKSTDLIKHSRVFIVQRAMTSLKGDQLDQLLVARDFNGRNCLHYAAQNNRADLLDIILPYFPRDHLDALDNDSMSALLLAIKHENFEVIKKMVESGCNVYPEMDDEKLQYFPINYACKIGNYETVKYLLTAGNPNSNSMNALDVEGLSPLHVVARSGHHLLVQLLVENGSNVNHVDSLNKWPPLFYAASEGNLKTTQELLRFGAKVDIVDEDGYNVLYYCVVEGNISLLNELLKYYPAIIKSTKEDFSNIIDDSLADKQPGSSGTSNENASSMAILDEEEDSEDSNDLPKNVDTIPDLQLPPPILPLRRYGHNFLEQKVLIELVFPNSSKFINLFNSGTDLKPGRITLSSNISDIVPRNIILPSADETRVSNCIFQTDMDSLNEFRIDFEIFPKFGTRLIGKTTVLSFAQLDTSSSGINSIRLPLFDLRLKNIGEICFNCQVIFPFAGVLLEASKFDTYWKSSTKIVKRKTAPLTTLASSPNTYLSPSTISNTIGSNQTVTSTAELVSGNSTTSFVTATSLSGKYLRIKVCLLNDGTPVVCPHWSISITDSIELYLPNMTLEQLTSITDNLFDYNKVVQDLSQMSIQDLELIKKLLKIIYLPLELVLQIIDVEINLNIEIIFPSEYEIRNLPFAANVSSTLNSFIDYTLNDIFNHLRSLRANNKPSRSVIFISSNSLICKILNWKQPNFPVFLAMNSISFNDTLKTFEVKSTNGFLLPDSGDDSSEYSSFDEKDDDAEIHVKNADPDKLIENDQEQTSKSIKHAVNFAVNNNLIGLITSIHLLRLVPKLMPLIRSRGLILVATNDTHEEDEKIFSSKELDVYTKTEINGLRFDDVLTFKDDITM